MVAIKAGEGARELPRPGRWPGQLGRDLAAIDALVGQGSASPVPQLTTLEVMTLTLEDRRFLRHAGIDLRSVARELVRMIRGERHGGASTIEMQFARTCTGYRERTLVRKLYETILSAIIARRHAKLSVLRAYLRCAYFGSGLYGAEAASQKVFQITADDLDIEQAAVIAAMLACPRPLEGSERWARKVKRRADYGVAVHASGRVQLPGLRPK